jgi:erythronate-4-phosphate dehydrogenase
MRIVADSGILGLDALNLEGADLVLLPGREITNDKLLNADALLVRSITRVDKALIDGTAVRFVGTATSGRNHLDEHYLNSRGIVIADSKGANASAVVDYVFAALAYCVGKGVLDAEFQRRVRIGIVGLGSIGGLLNKRLINAGFTTLCCDPPLASYENTEKTRSFVQLDEVMRCEVVCIHVPYYERGEYATRHLIGSRELGLLPPGALLINACRGGVVDEAALAAFVSKNDGFSYCSDVWQDEPIVATEVISAARLATPHIAGYSRQAKNAATAMLLTALEEYSSHVKTGTKAGKIRFSLGLISPNFASDSRRVHEFDTALSGWQIIERLFTLHSLDGAFRNAAAGGLTPYLFDSLRKELLQRQEFNNYSVCLKHDVDDSDKLLLAAVGIEVIRSDSCRAL